MKAVDTITKVTKIMFWPLAVLWERESYEQAPVLGSLLSAALMTLLIGSYACSVIHTFDHRLLISSAFYVCWYLLEGILVLIMLGHYRVRPVVSMANLRIPTHLS